jgi:iron complex transport system substrate-binding protein
MKKNLTFLLFFVFAISACAPKKAQTPRDIMVVDALGREVFFDSLPQKIVVAGRQTPMLANFFYLFENANDKIAAIERRSQSADSFLKIIDPEIESKYSLERDAGVEQIAPLDPDVVILKTSMRDSVGSGLEEIGIPVIYIDFESVDQIYRDLRIFAAILGEEERGNSLIDQYQKIKTDIDAEIEKAPEPPNVVVMQSEDLDGEKSFSVPSAIWLQTAMIDELGGIALWKEAAQSGGWTTINIEQLLNWNPDILFVINYQGNAPSIVEEFANDPLWQNMRAVENNQAYPFAYDFLSWDQPDPRWILGYSYLASKLYPELLNEEQTMDIVRTFYADFYRLSEDEFSQFVEPEINTYFE